MGWKHHLRPLFNTHGDNDKLLFGHLLKLQPPPDLVMLLIGIHPGFSVVSCCMSVRHWRTV